MTEDFDLLVCLPISLGPSGPGAVVDSCGKCGRPVWISPEGQAHLKANPATNIGCEPCVRPSLGAVESRAVPGAIEAIAERYGPRAAKEAELFVASLEDLRRRNSN